MPDEYFRTCRPDIHYNYMPDWMKDLYFFILAGKLGVNQMRVYLDAIHRPFVSPVGPSKPTQWGEEYTVQEFIDLVHERLQNE